MKSPEVPQDEQPQDEVPLQKSVSRTEFFTTFFFAQKKMFFEGLLLFATIFFGVSNLKYERVHYALLFHFCTSLWNLMVIPET